jgi:HAD superfamily phosphatase
MRKIPKLDLLLFDIDGVLIDVSASYRDTIRLTVQTYLQNVVGLPPSPGELVSHADVAAFKLAGGFNNDWDLTTGILSYFLALLDAPARPLPRLQTCAEIIAYLRSIGPQIDTTVESLRRRKDLQTFAHAVRSQGGGLAAVRRILGNRNNLLLFAEGDLRGTNLVQRIFEEIYLGEELFVNEYGESPMVIHDSGLIRRERLMIGIPALQELAKRGALGIATGRPRNQANYTLEKVGIAKYFQALAAHEDIVAAEEEQFKLTGQSISLAKPHPFPLLHAARRIVSSQSRCAYIGDTLDDVRAANAAKAEMDFVSIACLAPAVDKQAMRGEFERVGADAIVEYPDELVELIEK